VAQSLNNLALLYAAQGSDVDAEPLYLRAIAIDVKALGTEHPDLAAHLENYAVLLRKMNRHREAENIEVLAKGILARHAQDRPLASVRGRVRVAPSVQADKIIHYVQPMFPPLAKQARITGVVRLEAIIAKDGTVKDLAVLDGHPLLAQAALQVVQEWRYQPTLVDGKPVEVMTEVIVAFLPRD
jgi:TonB family protein